jgi:uncharacterized repeat protein (TIGR01451 family)/LPXTG-motif cell wall-anchored protein
MRVRREILGVVGGLAVILVSAPAAAQQQGSDLTITKTGPATAASGADVAFTVTVNNVGTDDLSFVDMFDTLPSNATFVSFTQDSGPTATIDLPDHASWISFPAGTSAVFTVSVSTATDFTGTVTNAANVICDCSELDDTNNEAAASTEVAPEADLTIAKTGPANGAPGADIGYTLTASNDGPNDAANASLTDTLPSGVTFVSMTQNSGPTATLTTPAVGASGTVTATWAAFDFDDTAVFTLTVNIGSGFSGDLLNTATITAETADPDTANNSSTATLAVTTSTTSTTTTTTVAATTTTTTVVATTTTTAAATTTTSVGAGGQLPATGNDSRGGLIYAAAALALGGLALIVGARRRGANQ